MSLHPGHVSDDDPLFGQKHCVPAYCLSFQRATPCDCFPCLLCLLCDGRELVSGDCVAEVSRSVNVRWSAWRLSLSTPRSGGPRCWSRSSTFRYLYIHDPSSLKLAALAEQFMFEDPNTAFISAVITGKIDVRRYKPEKEVA